MLPFVLPLRQYVNRLKVVFQPPYDRSVESFFNYPATKDFLKAINATEYRNCALWYPKNPWRPLANTEIYLTCPYTRQMDEVWIGFYNHCDVEHTIFRNRIGFYGNPTDEALNEFFHSSTNLNFHVYFDIRGDERSGYPLLKYLYGRYRGFEEQSEDTCNTLSITVTTEETGRKHKLKIYDHDNGRIDILIGREKIFDKMERQYRYQMYLDGMGRSPDSW